MGNYETIFVNAKKQFAVYQAEVDDKGIDFVIRKGHDRYFDIQVKSIRGLNYVFFPKRCFEERENLLAAVVVFMPAQKPEIFLMPSLAWHAPNALFVSRDYELPTQTSKPEWGLNLSQRNYELLADFRFERRPEYTITFMPPYKIEVIWNPPTPSF
jgi:hypothetical protein